MLLEIKKLKEELNLKYEESFKEYKKCREEYRKKILTFFDFEQKYIKVKNRLDREYYIFCDWVRDDISLDGERDLIYLSGYGFSEEIYGYNDDNLIWGGYTEVDIDISTNTYNEDIVNSVTIISKEEFDNAFFEMIEKMKQYHNKFSK